jgi:8-oxo-dGTP pyrophosphatase MutT (NUDIX family)
MRLRAPIVLLLFQSREGRVAAAFRREGPNKEGRCGSCAISHLLHLSVSPRWLAADFASCGGAGGSRARPALSRRGAITRRPDKRKVRAALRLQYAALPYRFSKTAALEILLVTTRRSKRWIIPKGWPIKGLRPAKSAAREAFEEAGVRGKVGTKSIGVFTYDKMLDEDGIPVNCEVKVFPLLVKRQSEAWPEIEQRLAQWVEPSRAISLIREPELKALVAAFAKRVAGRASAS